MINAVLSAACVELKRLLLMKSLEVRLITIRDLPMTACQYLHKLHEIV
jgi:hypothetical protein